MSAVLQRDKGGDVGQCRGVVRAGVGAARVARKLASGKELGLVELSASEVDQREGELRRRRATVLT